MATMEPTIYNAKDVALVIDGRTVQGFQENDMFSFTFKEDRVNTNVDAQGFPSIAVNNNHLAQITVNLSGNSADHKRLNDLATKSTVFPISVDTPIEKISANQCIVNKPADSAYGKGTPARTYTIQLLDAELTVK